MSSINNNQNNENNDNLILFFHEESSACQKLKDFLPKDKNIQLVDISKVNNIPAAIKSVPSLIVNNKEVLSGKKVFDYFKKDDEMEYLNIYGKNTNFGFATISDSENAGPTDSNGMFSSIDMPSMSEGIPTWDENNENNKETLDIDRLQAQRAEMVNNMKVEK